MFLKLFPLFTIGFWGVIAVPLPSWADPITPLNRAEVQNLRNAVQLIPRVRVNKRPARKSDAILPGDGLSTGRASLADLRFNDGSLARVGEQAVFQFLPKTRNFTLSNGTVLLLIPQGRGQTRVQTPSAAAAIRGSALFVRYDKPTDTTIVGALTNSGIEVFNKKASQNQVLQAGQLMVIVKGQFQGLYDFDLKNFYETSELVQGLNLTSKNATSMTDPAIAGVQAEIAAALASQSSITGEGVIDNPSFLQLTTNSENSSTFIKDDSPIDLFVETGQILFNNSRQSEPVTPPITEPVKPPDIEPVKPPTEPVKPPTDPIKPPDPEPEIIYDDFGNPIPR